MPVDFERQELRDVKAKYDLIRDTLAGSKKIKELGTKYLPMPNPDDLTFENILRYNAYKKRAVFYNITLRTLTGLKGQIDLKPHRIELSRELSFLEDDANGNGISLEQMAKRSCSQIIAYGRSSLLVDFPRMGEAYTTSDVQKGIARPNILIYDPWSVINWKTKSIGGKIVYTLVVLKEIYLQEIDMFEVEERIQYRILALDDDGYYYQVVVKDEEKGNLNINESDRIYPKKNGEKFEEIPFAFLGSENNDSVVDEPPLYTIADINIGHYVNSASYEDSCHVVGQPTLVTRGLLQRNIDKHGPIKMGSNVAINVTEKGGAEILQVKENTMAMEAMKHKESVMVSLGANVIQQRMVKRTATESGIDHISETSILADCVKNVTSGYQKALEWCNQFVGTTSKSMFILNTDFNLRKMDSQERQQLMMEWQHGAVDDESYGKILKDEGIIKNDHTPKLRSENTDANLPVDNRIK